MFKKKRIIVNELIPLCICSYEEYNHVDYFYYWDKRKNKLFGQYHELSERDKERLSTDTFGRFIKLPQHIGNSRYKSLIEDLNNASVKEYFNESKCEEEAYYRYRCFIDANGIGISEWYKTELIIIEILINWCKLHNIEYTVKPISPPKDYIYDGRNLNNINWEIPLL